VHALCQFRCTTRRALTGSCALTSVPARPFSPRRAARLEAEGLGNTRLARLSGPPQCGGPARQAAAPDTQDYWPVLHSPAQPAPPLDVVRLSQIVEVLVCLVEAPKYWALQGRDLTQRRLSCWSHWFLRCSAPGILFEGHCPYIHSHAILPSGPCIGKWSNLSQL